MCNLFLFYSIELKIANINEKKELRLCLSYLKNIKYNNNK